MQLHIKFVGLDITRRSLVYRFLCYESCKQTVYNQNVCNHSFGVGETIMSARFVEVEKWTEGCIHALMARQIVLPNWRPTGNWRGIQPNSQPCKILPRLVCPFTYTCLMNTYVLRNGSCYSFHRNYVFNQRLGIFLE